MKASVIALWLIGSLLINTVVVYGQNTTTQANSSPVWNIIQFLVPDIGQLLPLLQVVYPCAVQSGINELQLLDIRDGNFSSLNSTGCLFDCISMKIGVLTDETGVTGFEPKVLMEKISRVVKEDRAKEFMQRCTRKLGIGKCQVTGPIFECILENVLATLVQ